MGQFIQISNVRPIADLPYLSTTSMPMPEKIARFYQVNDVTRFQHDRPIYKGNIDKDNEFKSLWIERTTLDISSPLPGILRWFEIIDRSVIELTPVEFACETMANVEKELCDHIAQYKSDPSKNINPFSMRLQGIIDANVMGGISKYQEAFFTEQFTKSAEGIIQQNNVNKLKYLIHEQVKILDTALELHGQLAPDGVQPLHKRLLERFSQLKQSLTVMDKLKRQHSESIVNTPLPPLPIEKRAMSLGTSSSSSHQCPPSSSSSVTGNYELDDIYTRPMDNSGGQMKLNRHDLNLPELNRDTIINGQNPVPPIPIRPKSAGYVTITDSPEIPPKNMKEKSNAPPLPPRGYTPDKRASNPIPYGGGGSVDFDQNNCNTAPNIPRRSHKYSVVNISLDDECEADHQFVHHHHHHHPHQFQQQDTASTPNDENMVVYRDSGISTSSNDLNNPKYRHSNEDSSIIVHNTAGKMHHQQKANSNSKSLNIQATDSNSCDGIGGGNNEDYDDSESYPPPIPPKSNIFLTQEQGIDFNNGYPVGTTLTSTSSSNPQISTSSMAVSGEPTLNNDADYCAPKSTSNNEKKCNGLD